MKNYIFLSLLTFLLLSCIGGNDSTISYEYDGELVEFESNDIRDFNNLLGVDYSITATQGRSTDDDFKEMTLTFITAPIDSMYQPSSYSLSIVNNGQFFIDASKNEELTIIENSNDWFRAEFSFDQPTGTPFEELEIRNGRIDIEK